MKKMYFYAITIQGQNMVGQQLTATISGGYEGKEGLTREQAFEEVFKHAQRRANMASPCVLFFSFEPNEL